MGTCETAFVSGERKGSMVYIILGNGFEEIEAVAPYDVLKRGGVDVRYAGIGGKKVSGSHGIVINCETTVEDMGASAAELVVVPGGLGGVESILASEKALAGVKAAYDAGRKVAAICAGPLVLAKLGILEGVKAVCYPGMEEQMTGGAMTQESSTQVDGNIITGRGPGAAIDFGLRLLEELRGPETAREVASAMHYERR